MSDLSPLKGVQPADLPVLQPVISLPSYRLIPSVTKIWR